MFGCCVGWLGVTDGAGAGACEPGGTAIGGVVDGSEVSIFCAKKSSTSSEKYKKQQGSPTTRIPQFKTGTRLFKSF